MSGRVPYTGQVTRGAGHSRRVVPARAGTHGNSVVLKRGRGVGARSQAVPRRHQCQAAAAGGAACASVVCQAGSALRLAYQRLISP